MIGVLDNRMCSLTEQIAQGHADEMSAWPWHRFAQNGELSSCGLRRTIYKLDLTVRNVVHRSYHGDLVLRD